MAKHSDPAPTGYWQRTRTLSLSLVFVIPLLLFYEIGLIILQPKMMNGAGVFVKVVLSQVGPLHYVFTVLVGLTLMVAFVKSNRQGSIDTGYFGLLIFESVVWAFFMMVFAVVFTKVAMDHLPTLAAESAASAGEWGSPVPEGWNPRTYRAFEAVVHSCGAGVYEEILFRLLLLSGLVAMFSWLMPKREREGDPKVPLLLALGVSAVLFALAHHIPPQPPPDLAPMIFRTVCGFCFGVMYLVRGLAVAVYTHTIYDTYVFFVKANLI